MVCGYAKSFAALQFHHPNDNKEFTLASLIPSRSYASLLPEAQKCELLCANCHAERHYLDIGH
jgi:hypothetical protein